jgi:predicted nucleotidyltransferase
MNMIEKYKNQIQQLCIDHNVKQLFVFGSVLTNEFNDESDIDLIVEFEKMDPIEYMENYFNMKFSLEDLFKRKIDLLENQSISNPIFQKVIDKNKELVYDRRNKELVN